MSTIRVFAYGCLPPTLNKDLVEDQFFRAGRYYNTLVAVERARRGRVRGAQRAIPQLAELFDRVDALDFAVQEAVAAVNAKRCGTGRSADVEQEVAVVVALKAERKTAQVALHVLKGQHTETLTAAYEAADEGARAERRAARAASGLRHGTYIRVEDAVNQASRAKVMWEPGKRVVPWTERPAFKRYDGEGSIGTQLTGDNLDENDSEARNRQRAYRAAVRIRRAEQRQDHEHRRAGVHLAPRPDIPRPSCILSVGLLVSDIATDTRVQIDPVPADCYDRARHQRRLASRTVARLRVGSNSDRSPVWAEFPVILHRPLPPGVVKWAYVVRKRIGRHFRYSLQITLESLTFHRPTTPTGSGTLLVNYGWRNLLDGGIRVAYWRNDQGEEGEVRVPEHLRSGFTKVDDLESIRDRHLDEVKAWVAGLEGLPPWVRTRIGQIRAQHKLGTICNRLEKMVEIGWRFDGDVHLLGGLALWWQRDRHLRDWSANMRSRLIGHRRDVYRNLAAQWARRYATIVYDTTNFRDFAEEQPPEEGIPSDGNRQRSTAKIAAPGELRETVQKAADKYGSTVEEVQGAYRTQACNACGHCPEEPWDAARAVMHRCAECGARWDQDSNHVHNLWAARENASGPVTRQGREVLARRNGAMSQGNGHGVSETAPASGSEP